MTLRIDPPLATDNPGAPEFSPPQRRVDHPVLNAARAVVEHWRKFGGADGFDEAIAYLERTATDP